MATDSVEKFIRLLKKSPPGAVFNPWWQVDKQNDIGRNAPGIRRKQLGAYFRKRLGKTKLAVIGEAVGYRGGHFSGIPMTSERMLVGKKKDDGIEPEQVFSSPAAAGPRRTSKPPRRGMLSNRTPTKKEQAAGLSVLKAFLDLFPCYEIVALGKVAASQLKELDVEMHRVRHPASGGAKLFRRQIAKILRGFSSGDR